MEKKGKRVKPSRQRLQAKGEISTLQAGKDIKQRLYLTLNMLSGEKIFFLDFSCTHGHTTMCVYMDATLLYLCRLMFVYK